MREEIYETVYDAVRTALADDAGGTDIALLRRMQGGSIVFKDDQQRVVKEVDVFSLFRKVTAVRDKLRVLEQKVNNNKSMSAAEKAELQAYITKAYGSLTSFNFLFAEPGDRFRGTGG